jgi:hypothetical protein
MLIAKRRDRSPRVLCRQATVSEDGDGEDDDNTHAPQDPSSPPPPLTRRLLGHMPLRPTWHDGFPPWHNIS